MKVENIKFYCFWFETENQTSVHRSKNCPILDHRFMTTILRSLFLLFNGEKEFCLKIYSSIVSSEQPSLSQLSDRKNERRLSSWISPYPSRKGNFTPAASFPLDDEETDLNGRYNYMALSPTSPYDPNQSPPSPQPSNFVHQGFLDFRNRKKRWER